MKSIAAVIVLFLFSVQTFSKWVWVLNYNLNQAYIAKNLCINKEKPKLHCNGKCQLNKKLSEDESNKEGSGNTVQKSMSYSVFFKSNIESELPRTTVALVPPQASYVGCPCAATLPAVFHPPAV